MQKKGRDIIAPGLDIWHYDDADVQSHQLNEKKWEKPVTRTAVSLISNGQVQVLEKGDTILCGLPGDRYAITKTNRVETEAAWHHSQIPYYNLIEIATGRRIPLPGQPQKLESIALSPGERFVIWTDSNHIWSYEMATGVSRNLTKGIPVMMMSKAPCRYDEYYAWSAFRWIINDRALIACDQYDVWQIDPAGIQSPVNLTAAYGRKNNISFRPITQEKTILSPSQQFILTALDNATKDNGFWTITLGKSADPRKGTMDDCIYYFPGIYVFDHQPPQKAANTESYIMLRERENEQDNLFVTKDFKNFIALTDFASHKKYNWYTTELITWKTFDGTMNQGILYKPEDFDSTKKYPLIFTYYEEKTKELNHFIIPRESTGPLNVAAYASSGYLVFVPDIIRPTGQNTKTILNVVESAVKHLSQFSWVNTKKLGIQGQSFGGYITNVLATRSNLFAAAQTSCGASDITAGFGITGFGGLSYIYITERGQVNMGTTPWDDPQLYVEDSPVYHAGNCTTPLLLMHNKNDDAVQFTQGVAMYMALRRQNKPVWMLQYDGEGHVLMEARPKKDFTKRQRQFFDHYLRDQPAPLWMTKGVDASDKGKISGFELQSAAR